jgi:hypothetical protein
MVSIIAGFMYNVQCDEHTGSQPYRQAEHIDACRYFIFLQVSPGNFKICFYHDDFYVKFKNQYAAGKLTAIGQQGACNTLTYATANQLPGYTSSSRNFTFSIN